MADKQLLTQPFPAESIRQRQGAGRPHVPLHGISRTKEAAGRAAPMGRARPNVMAWG
jgi:hypothetical protein